MNYIIIAAGGKSKRFGKDKLLLKIHGKPVLLHTIEKFQGLGQIIVVQNGEKTRQESVWKGLLEARKLGAKNSDIIIVHNGANPLVTKNEIKKCIKYAKKYGACSVGNFVIDTIKEVNNKGEVIKTLKRENLIAVQTPQAARFGILYKAHQKAKKEKVVTTDDISLIENLGRKVKIIKASTKNFKITNIEDFEYAKFLMGDLPNKFRIGFGHDSHKFGAKGSLVLGGLKISKYKKLEANSDGDCVLHAIYNAIAEALGDRSLGSIADKLCKKGIKDSKEYIKKILEKMQSKNFEIHYCGISIEGKYPLIDPISEKMKNSLSKILGVSSACIGITATTGEGLTPFGKGEGVQCFSNIILKNK